MRLALGLGTKAAGGGGAFDPASLFGSGEKGGFWDVSSLAHMWQDTAGTTPAVVDTSVGRIDDLSGNGNHLLQTTGGKRPILRQSGAIYWLEFDGVTQSMGAVLASAITGAILTEGIAGRLVTGIGANARIMSLATTPNDYSSQASILLLYYNATGIGSIHQSVNGPISTLALDTDGVVINAVDATDLYTKKDAGATTSSPHGVTPALNAVDFSIGEEATTGGSNAKIYFHGGMMINRALLAAEATSLTTWLGARQGRTL